MQRSEPLTSALGAAAVGLALIDAGGAEARTRPIEGVRLAQSQVQATTGDAYQDGRALLALGDTAGAIAAFRAALVASPQSIDALNGLGVAYDRLGRFDLSRSWYDTALAIDPDAVLVLNNLGYSLYLQGRYAAAIPLLQRVAASDDDAARRAGQRVLTLVAARMRADAIEGRAPVMVATKPATEPMLAREHYAAPAAVAPAAVLPSIAAVPPSIAAVRPAAASRAGAMGRVQPARARPAVVEVEAPPARIEITSSGEQRLVLGGPAPAPELVASLGDAAPMVMVANAWTPREESRLAAREAAAARAERVANAQLVKRAELSRQLAAALGATRHPPTAPGETPAAPPLPNVPPPALMVAAVRSDAPIRHTTAMAEQALPAEVHAATIVPAHATSADAAHAPTIVAAHSTTAVAAHPATIVAAHATTTAAVQTATAAAAPATNAGAHPAADGLRLQTIDPATDDAAPAWLLASRRLQRPSPAAAAHDEPASDRLLAFDSDDPELNAFAARMRGIEPAKLPPAVSTAEAVTRLGGLLRRLRAA